MRPIQPRRSAWLLMALLLVLLLVLAADVMIWDNL
jgi:hypothetical protein